MLLFPVYLLVLLVFVNRYIAGWFFRGVRGKALSAVRADFVPSVSVVVPMYNEGRGICRTIASLLEQDYPPNKLDIVVVDDCSTDDSYAYAAEASRGEPRVKLLRNPYNMGKRRGIAHAVRETPAELIVSVDSDVLVERDAIGKLVARFVRPQIAAVGGRVDVWNAHDSWLTRMQAIKYYFGYEYMKNLERAFSSVMCLSGCLTAYRRSVLLELEPVLESRSCFGVPIKYGEDRYLTRQIIKAGYQTALCLDAVCWTVAPNTLQKYFAQQLRWRRSNLIDFGCGLSHAFRLHPIIAVHWLSLFAVLVAYPLIIYQNLLAGEFFALAYLHCRVLALLGVIYALGTRGAPPERRVHPVWLLPALLVMPVVYLVYTPLALFTLDSGSWETRKPSAAAPNQMSASQAHTRTEP